MYYKFSATKRGCRRPSTDECGPSCRKFGGDNEADCQLVKGQTTQQLIDQFGRPILQKYLEGELTKLLES